MDGESSDSTPRGERVEELLADLDAMRAVSPEGVDPVQERRQSRVKVIGRLPGETSCLTLVWAVLDRASAGD